MRLRPETCKALQAACPEMQTFSNAVSTFHVAADVLTIAWSVAREMEDTGKAARWDKWPLASERAEELVEWLLKAIEKTPTSWAGLLLRAELARDAHDNGDGALTIIVGDLTASTREADDGVAEGKKPLPYMANLTYGALQSSAVGFRAIAWMELNRAAEGARLRSRVASAAVRLAYDTGILVDGGDDWDVGDEETAVAVARVIAQACGTYDLWLYSQQGVQRTSMAHEELNAAYDTTMDGRNPFYTARISAMVSLAPTLRCHALKGAPASGLVGLLVQYGGACLPPHHTGQAFLWPHPLASRPSSTPSRTSAPGLPCRPSLLRTHCSSPPRSSRRWLTTRRRGRRPLGAARPQRRHRREPRSRPARPAGQGTRPHARHYHRCHRLCGG